MGLVCAGDGEDLMRFLVRRCEGHHETAVSGKEWVGFFDQIQWLVKKFKLASSVGIPVSASAMALVAGWVSLVV